ncbi:MAG: thiamine pyrophosphate-binding protein [Halobacteriota archaeon]
MQISDAVIDTLRANDIDTIFGIPGKQTLPLNESIGQRADVRYVMARHETNVTHQAWGYAETSGRMAATVVIPGPGDMNAMNGLKNALNDNTPLVHIAVETEPHVRGGDGIHETPPETYDTVVKENVLVESPQATIAALQRAITIARTPPKGPVRVGIPKNFVPMDVEIAEIASPAVPKSVAPSADAIERAADALDGADAPFVVAGGGVRSADATDPLLAVAERIEAPVATTYKGKATVPEDHRLFAGVIGGGTSTELRTALEAADVVLAVGTDFDAVWTREWSYDLPTELIHVTLDATHVGRGYEPSVGIVGDAGRTLRALESAVEAAPEASRAGADRAATVREARTERLAPLAETETAPFTTVSALLALRDALPRETVVAADAGGSRIWTQVAFPTYAARAYVNPGSWATMGVGLPAGIGATLANPDAPVAVFIGEGGLLMCLEELHTVAAEDLSITVFVFTNDDYAVISEEAEREYALGEGAYGWGDAPLDIVAIAEGMGLDAVRVETIAELDDVARTVTDDVARVVSIPTDPDEPQAGTYMTQ